jgi:uncharacterized protein (UPF0248 family)
MKNKFYIQINSNTLPHYVVSGCIRPVDLIKKRESDIQNIFSDFVLISNKKWSLQTDCSLEIILTDSEIRTLKQINENYLIFDNIIPLSRVVKIYFTEKEKSETILWNIETGAGFLPDKLIFIESKVNEEVSNLEIVHDGSSNDKQKLLSTYNRFNRIMGGFAFFKTALYDLKDLNLNYPVNYFTSLALYNDVIKQITEDNGINLPSILNEILNNENVISKFIGKDITNEVVNHFSIKENINLQFKFGQIQIEEIPTDSVTFNLAVLNNYGKSKSKSVEDLIAVLFEKLEPIKREEIALIFGLNTGYEELRNSYKLKNRIFNVKFDFESRLDYHIVETLYLHSNHIKSSKFEYLDEIHKFKTFEDKIDNEYNNYSVLGSAITVKRKDYLEGLEKIVETIIGSITSWFPKGLFSLQQSKMKTMFVSKVKQIYLNEIETIKKDVSLSIKEKQAEAGAEHDKKEPEIIEITTSTISDKEDSTKNSITPNEINEHSLRKKELEKLKIVELRKLAKHLGITGCSKDKLEEIIPKIIKAETSNSTLL